MKKSWIVLPIVLLLTSVFCVTSAFAVWFADMKISDKNEVSIGTFSDIRVTGSILNDEYSADGQITAVFKVIKYLNDGKVYTLMLCDLNFYEDTQNKTEWNGHIGEVWEFTYYTDAQEAAVWSDLSANATAILPDAANGDEVTLCLRQKENAATAYTYATLEFSIKLMPGDGEDV